MADVEAHVNEEAEYPVSDNEIYQFKRMVTDFVDWLHDMALLDDEGYLDDTALDDVCADMARSFEGEEE